MENTPFTDMPDELLDEMPEELRLAFERKQSERIERLESFGASLASKREDAINGKTESGIEDIWREDEDAYEGLDEATSSNGTVKPRSSGGDSINRSRSSSVLRSTVFLNITRPYVDAAAAKIADMLLPTDDRNWGINPTPIPDFIKHRNNPTPVNGLDGQQMSTESVGADGMPVQKPMTFGDLAKQEIEEARLRAGRAEKRIEDWLIECQYHAEVRKVIEDTSRLGTGILKGPHPVLRRKKKITNVDGVVKVEVKETLMPDSRRIDPWNFYPDPSCGECIHNGNYTFERDEITGKQLRELKNIPGYESSQIDKVLQEGPGKKLVQRFGRNEASNDREKYEIWYYYGEVDTGDLKSVNKKIGDDNGEKISAIVTMVNDCVIKGALNPLDSGEFPYDVMVWQRRTNNWTGIGVGRHIRTPQRMLNAATRNMMDNAGLSAGPQIIMRRNAVIPANGNWEITPRKLWYVNEDSGSGNVSDAMGSIVFPTLQAELMSIIQYAQKMAEDVTGLPMLMQGQQGLAPETVGGMQMLFNNASTVLRRIARTFDDSITEPHIRRYYEWLMLYGEDEEEKGDFSIDARGSTALVERDVQNQALLQMSNFIADPEFGVDKRKWFMEMVKTQRLDPAKFTYSDEQMQANAENAAKQPPPPDPRVISAESSIKVAQIRAESDNSKETIQSQTDMQELEFRRETMAMDNQARREELAINREIKIMELAQAQNMSIAQIKAQLADTAIKERSKKELQAAEIIVKQQHGSGI